MAEAYTQGQAQTDAILFSLVGHWAVSPIVAKKLGTSVTGEDGDVWFISFDDDGKAVGFAQLRFHKNKSAHIRYLYSDNGFQSVYDDLIEKIFECVHFGEVSSLYTNDRRDSDIWPDLGFKPKDNKRGGSFIRWEWSKAMEDVE